MNSGLPSRKMRDCELVHNFCFWKPYKHTRKMAKVLSFETFPQLYWKNDKGVEPANGIQPAFCGDFVITNTQAFLSFLFGINLLFKEKYATGSCMFLSNVAGFVRLFL